MTNPKCRSEGRQHGANRRDQPKRTGRGFHTRSARIQKTTFFDDWLRFAKTVESPIRPFTFQTPPSLNPAPLTHKSLLYLTFLPMPSADTLFDIETPSRTPSTGGEKKILLLKPRGFCAGVVRAIDVVKIALDLYGAPIYVRKEIVHNRHVVEELRHAGAIFVEELAEVPEGARVIFSAHGVAPAVRQEAEGAQASGD